MPGDFQPKQDADVCAGTVETSASRLDRARSVTSVVFMSRNKGDACHFAASFLPFDAFTIDGLRVAP